MLFLLLMAQLIVPAVSSAQPSGLRGRVIAAVQRYINRHQGSCFSSVVSLGDIARFRRALNWATIEIDPAYVRSSNAQAAAVRGAFSGATLKMLADPQSMSPTRLQDYERTLYHETIHLIEYQNGDSDRTKDWNERHPYYYEAMERYVFTVLTDLERLARNPSVPLVRLRGEWNKAVRNFQEGARAENATYPRPPDINLIESWLGARVRMTDIEQLYRSGRCGPRLRDMLTPGAVLTGLTIQNLRVPRQPFNRTNRTTGSVTFSAQGVANTWTSNVNWFVIITGPARNKSEERYRQQFGGTYSVQGPGPHTRPFSFALPWSALAGGYQLSFRVSVSRIRTTQVTPFNHTFPPGTALTGLIIQNLSVGDVPRRPSDRTTRFNGNVTFTGQGVTSAWNGSFTWVATVTGPRNFRQVSRGTFAARGPGPHTRSYGFNLPLRAREGTYRLSLQLSAEKHQAARDTNFRHSYPPMSVRINRPRSVLQGQPAEVQVELTQGTHDFWWEWSGGGTRGNGRSQRFVMRIPYARTPAITFNLQVWDEGRNRDNPVTRTVTVPVRGQPTGPEIVVALSYPRESAVGRRVTLAGNASGGLGILRAQWTTPTGGTVDGYRVQGEFRTAGDKTFILRVWDQGKYQTKPKQVVARVRVYQKLEARILGPNLIESGKRLQLSAEARGGKQNYRYLWTLPDGQQVRQRSFSQIVRGRPGSEIWYRLSVVDSLRPRQRVNLTRVIRIREKPQIVIRGVRVLPGTIAPGKNAVVRAQFSVRGFQGPQVPVLARIWMENSSGTNRGITRDRRIVVRPGRLSRVEARLLTHPRARTGPIRATVQIWAGRLTQVAHARAEIKVERPGGLQDVTVNRRAIRLLIRDHGTADGDRIAIILNNRIVSRDLTLTKRGHQFTLALRPGKNQLTIRAHNEGRQSPNTAEIKLTNVVRGKEKQKYRLKSGKEGFFFIVAP